MWKNLFLFFLQCAKKFLTKPNKTASLFELEIPLNKI